MSDHSISVGVPSRREFETGSCLLCDRPTVRVVRFITLEVTSVRLCVPHFDDLRDSCMAQSFTWDERRSYGQEVGEDNPDSLTDQELPYDCPHREADGAWCGYPVGKAGVCKRGHRSE